jgi:hypothetical protein
VDRCVSTSVEEGGMRKNALSFFFLLVLFASRFAFFRVIGLFFAYAKFGDLLYLPLCASGPSFRVSCHVFVTL